MVIGNMKPGVYTGWAGFAVPRPAFPISGTNLENARYGCPIQALPWLEWVHPPGYFRPEVHQLITTAGITCVIYRPQPPLR